MKQNQITRSGAVGYVDADKIPGVVVKDGRAFGEAGGRLWPVTGAVMRHGKLVPILDIPMCDDLPGGTVVSSSEEACA